MNFKKIGIISILSTAFLVACGDEKVDMVLEENVIDGEIESEKEVLNNNTKLSDEEVGNLVNKVRLAATQGYEGVGYVKLIHSQSKILLTREVSIDVQENPSYSIILTEQVGEASYKREQSYKDGVLKEIVDGKVSEERKKYSEEELESNIGEVVRDVMKFKEQYFSEFLVITSPAEMLTMVNSKTGGYELEIKYGEGIVITAELTEEKNVKRIVAKKTNPNTGVFISQFTIEY